MPHIKKITILALALILLATTSIFSTAAKPSAPKPYTIMIYMNGSDLESDFGAATTDLVEILDSGLDSRNANVVILTGGANRWQNAVIPVGDCIVWEVSDGWLTQVANFGSVNMGNPHTLADFIRYGMDNYPSKKYGLIMWDHGGGTIAGFGHDELFNDDALTLRDMKLAFEEAGLRENKLEFLGFDACLMATIEMAYLAADYAHVMIASEDTEPGDGWDYVFLSALNDDPNMDGIALGKIIVDTFMDFYGPDSDEVLSLSVMDLARVQPVMTALGRLMAQASNSIATSLPQAYLDSQMHHGTHSSHNLHLYPPHIPDFHELAFRRGLTKTFGEGSPRDNYCDMVDIGDMAVLLKEFFPREAEALIRALNRCVVYNRHNSDIDLYGLSAFYIYGGKSEGVHSLRIYSDLDMNPEYTQYLHHFFNGLLNRRQAKDTHPHLSVRSELVLWQPVNHSVTDTTPTRYRMAGLLQTEIPADDLLWPQINGQPVSLFPIATTSRNRLYAVPVQVNGRDGDIIIVFNRVTPQGHIKGIRYNDGQVIQKGHDPIEPGDKIAIYALEWDITKDSHKTWHKGEAFTVNDRLRLTWHTAPKDNRLGYRHTDAYRDVSYTPPF